MTRHACRACHSHDGAVVLDLGNQPAADNFPAASDPGPDPTHPLQMWLCGSCGLAQLFVDPTVPEEPRGAEPAALIEQAADAVARVAAAGWLSGHDVRMAEYGSPHGGSWLPLLAERGIPAVAEGEPAHIVLDCFGLMHAADQGSALVNRADRVAPGGALLLQYHSLATILRWGQWNSLRHGHYGYYSTTALTGMLADVGFTPQSAWQFDLYGGTVLLVATRADSAGGPDASVSSLLADENAIGVTDSNRLRRLQDRATSDAKALHGWLSDQRDIGNTVLGYGAASRAVALLSLAGVDRRLLPAVADASADKQGRRMPATNVPVVGPKDLIDGRPDVVLVFLPELLSEARRRLPQVETHGGRWLTVDHLLSRGGLHERH